MLQVTQTALLWFSAIGCAVIGGVYFTFSTFAMTAFGKLDRAVGMVAMQAINEVILRSLFMPLFFGTTIAAVLLAVLAIVDWTAPSSSLILSASVLFAIGMFVVTLVFNVPMNNALMAADARSGEGAAVWTHYLATWTLWNHVRTITSIGASVIYVVVLVRG